MPLIFRILNGDFYDNDPRGWVKSTPHFLLALLAHHLNEDPTSSNFGKCCPAEKSLAEEMHLGNGENTPGLKTVSHWIQWLRRHRYIKEIDGRQFKGALYPTRYWKIIESDDPEALEPKAETVPPDAEISFPPDNTADLPQASEIAASKISPEEKLDNLRKLIYTDLKMPNYDHAACERLRENICKATADVNMVSEYQRVLNLYRTKYQHSLRVDNPTGYLLNMLEHPDMFPKDSSASTSRTVQPTQRKSQLPEDLSCFIKEAEDRLPIIKHSQSLWQKLEPTLLQLFESQEGKKKAYQVMNTILVPSSSGGATDLETLVKFEDEMKELGSANKESTICS